MHPISVMLEEEKMHLRINLILPHLMFLSIYEVPEIMSINYITFSHLIFLRYSPYLILHNEIETCGHIIRNGQLEHRQSSQS